MITKEFWLFSSMIAVVFLMAFADHRNTLKVRKIDCSVAKEYSEYLQNFTCDLKAISRYRSIINAHIYLMKPFGDVMVNMQIFKKNSMRYLPFMVNGTTNICRFLNGTGIGGFYSKFMIRWIRRFSNVNHSCPYEGILFVKGLEPVGENIPVFIPAGDYRLDVNFYEHSLKHWMGTIRGYAIVAVKTVFDMN